MSTNPSLKSSANAADDPSNRIARTRKRDTRDIFISFTGPLLNTGPLEKVTDCEFEDDGLLAREGPERDAPLEPERADRREPAEPEPPARAVGVDVQGTQAGVLTVGDIEWLQFAVLIFQIEGVATVGEHDAPDPDLVEDRKLDLGVGDDLDVAADQERVQRAVRRLRGQRADDRPQRQRGEPADVVDAAREVTLEDRHAARVAADDQVPLQLGPEDERSPERIEEPRHTLIAVEDVLRERDVGIGDLGGDGVVPTAAGEHAIVARIVGERGPDRRGDPRAEEVGDAARGDGDPDGRRPEEAPPEPEGVGADADLFQLVSEEEPEVLGQEV